MIAEIQRAFWLVIIDRKARKAAEKQFRDSTIEVTFRKGKQVYMERVAIPALRDRLLDGDVVRSVCARILGDEK